jgi:hypothetical protein
MNLKMAATAAALVAATEWLRFLRPQPWPQRPGRRRLLRVQLQRAIGAVKTEAA